MNLVQVLVKLLVVRKAAWTESSKADLMVELKEKLTEMSTELLKV
jgi:hypothetical protein